MASVAARPTVTFMRGVATLTKKAASELVKPKPASSIVVSGPSGSGKSTLILLALKEYPQRLAFSVSHTTRLPRQGEQNGIHYWFSTKDEMERMIANGEFLESAKFGDNLYGTSKQAVKDVERTGKVCVFELDLKGVHALKKIHPDAKYILIKAPSIDKLRQRLVNRKSETEKTLQMRLQRAQDDLAKVTDDLFDFVIVNDDLQTSYNEFLEAIAPELKIKAYPRN